MEKYRTAPPRSSVDFVATELYMHILEGRYAPGTFIRLNDVATELGVSMMPVREAIRELASLGIVEMLPNRGAQVRELSIEDLVETYCSRLHLETLTLRLGAPKFTPEQAAAAREANAERIAAVEKGDSYAMITAHERFHFLLYEACENSWLVRALIPGWRNTARYRDLSFLSSQVRREHDAQHAEMIEAMAAHDGERAVTVLYRHLTTAAEEVAQEIAGVSVLDRLPQLEELLG
ncbi:GntR family transcriptional regulator [Microbacterium sp. YJN-G]|uniref:GntR family transcriptional regulator n=1 Tax=Microbacterium sp. YJN-G TaxID=2763257 RepID=UPI001877DAFD|nr:GntR family transcriptional regulator [Microbacterium sp. YJN-G]